MRTVTQLFHEGGSSMFQILALALVALTFAGLHAGLGRAWASLTSGR